CGWTAPAPERRPEPFSWAWWASPGHGQNRKQNFRSLSHWLSQSPNGTVTHHSRPVGGSGATGVGGAVGVGGTVGGAGGVGVGAGTVGVGGGVGLGAGRTGAAISASFVRYTWVER